MTEKDDVDLASWLTKMLANEPDLRQNLGVAKETKRGNRVPQIILHENGVPIAYAELRRVGRAVELATVVVDPAHRGKGHSHQIVHQAWERWRQDPIVHGQSVIQNVDLFKVTRGDNVEQVLPIVRGPLISFTRDAAMAAALTGGGFTMLPRKRRASRLWLWKSDIAALPLMIQFNLMLDRALRGFRMVFTSPHSMNHYIRHSRDYRLFARVPEDANRLPPRMSSRSQRDEIQNHGVATDVIDQLEVVGYSENSEQTENTIQAWDEGE